MDQIVKHQPDWDKTINDNFAKFARDNATSDLIYLNGASKSNRNSFPMWSQCYHLGVVDMYTIQGYIDLPTIKAGQVIDILNIPNAGVANFAECQLFDDFLTNTLYLVRNDQKPGTISIHNSSATDVSAHTSGYNIIMLCPNNL